MCLGIPMQIKAISGTQARCEARGVRRDVSLFLLQDQPLAPGDWVMVHVGYAIQRMEPAQARTTWELLDDILAVETGADA